jgi:hypothetical protein
MENITIAATVVHKSMTAAEWQLSDYIPKASEIIVYKEDGDHPHLRQKIGDGNTLASALPFVSEKEISEAVAELTKKGEDLLSKTETGLQG